MTEKDIICKALEEDIGDGDHTSLATIQEEKTGKAQLIIKQNGILAGVDAAKKVFHQIDRGLTIEEEKKDGDTVKKGDIAFTITGKVVSILSGERLALNFMQRMSGIATATRQMVDQLEGLDTKILDTRKTTPNFRPFEKKAVRIGGGENHRFGLFDMIMIKDNHVDFAGGIEQAIKAVQEYMQKHHKKLFVEIEARNLDEVREVISLGGVDRIMLDNFSYDNLKKAVSIIGKKYQTEASGGVSLRNIRKYAECGVDYISVGALTHQIKSLDMSLKAVS
ncbi:MAG: carboxylating nicotinate-nucleotide diphosphorylase [Bacteroidales bacterium]|nr:carboxylating nicotinate-nucleotide diphosphorylase [Bacteroidales bacterium]